MCIQTKHASLVKINAHSAPKENGLVINYMKKKKKTEREGHTHKPYRASPISSWSNSERGLTIDCNFTFPPRLL